MAPRVPLIERIPPELYPLIVSCIPLYATPSTLFSLALTNKAMYNIFHNLLYTVLILKNEYAATSMIKMILNDSTQAPLGKLVRELHIQSELSVACIENTGEKHLDTVSCLKQLVKSGRIPHLHTLSLHLMQECRGDGDWSEVPGFGHLEAEFWEDMKRECPRVRSITLGGIGDQYEDPWLKDSGIYELKSIKVNVHFNLHSGFC